MAAIPERAKGQLDSSLQYYSMEYYTQESRLLNDRIMNSGFFEGIEQLPGTDAEGTNQILQYTIIRYFLKLLTLALTINCIKTSCESSKIQSTR